MLLPSPKEIKSSLPLSKDLNTLISSYRKQTKELISGADPRIAIVAGPCSIHHLDSAREYALRFRALAKKVEKTCWLVMRAYVEKPRTSVGWKGFLYDPYFDGSHTLGEGIFLSRQLLLSLVQLGVPIAMEFLDPLAAHYFEDLVTWGFIGARTCTSQTHRQLASSLPMPVGFKNSTDGSVQNAIHGVMSAKAPHTFIHINEEGRLSEKQSVGNESVHVVLRGSDEGPNYDLQSVERAIDQIELHQIHSRILIDCSHGNSQKQHREQSTVFDAILEQYLSGNTHILGAMLESHLEAGNQLFSEGTSSPHPSISVTDPCIDWSTTEELVLSAHERLSSSKSCLAFSC